MKNTYNIITSRAKNIFTDIFMSTSSDFEQLHHINALVIAAGQFPSFLPLIYKLTQTCSQLKSINFILVDPDKATTDLFEQHNEKVVENLLPNSITVSYSINNHDINWYLKNIANQTFDLIYFEHPDMSIHNVLMVKLRLSKDYLQTSLQESIPYLRKVMKPNSLIIASFLFKDELKHLISLLKYSLGVKIRRVRQSKSLIDGGYYSYGLVGVTNEKDIPIKSPEALAKGISFNSNCITMLVVLSVIIFLLSPWQLKIISLLFVMSQLFYYSFGFPSIVVRSMLIVGQLLVTFYS